MIRYLPLTCVLLALASGLHAASKDVIFKWIDDNGAVHYTQVPPQDREYETLKQVGAPGTAPAEKPASVRSDLQKQVEAMDKAQEERAEAKNQMEQQDRIRERRKKNCEISNRNLANLHQTGNRIFMTPDGEVMRLTDEERQRRIDEANRQIEENCK
ncbi:MAG: DUF4124 domain-containing protein [Thiohalobacterales bacterium]